MSSNVTICRTLLVDSFLSYRIYKLCEVRQSDSKLEILR